MPYNGRHTRKRRTYKSGSTSAIPYYYLYDENKAPGMTSVARTYTGGNNGYDFGDVISYANSGIKLFNGKTSQEKICFYGIIESDFWTSAAKQMFEDCVGFVGIACYSDDECPEDEIGNNYCSNSGVYQDNIQYTCENAGTVRSQCVANAVAELVEDCGESYFGDFGDDYCKNNNVFHNRTYYELGCFNGNCINSTSMNEELVEECGAEEVCMDGKCETIVCYVDSDCDDSNEYTVDVCNNPGTPQSYCSHVPRECLTNNDCNEDYYGENYCVGNSVYRDFHDFSCVGWLCQEQVTPQLVEVCSDVCLDGKCKSIVCLLHSDCGISGFSGNKYCSNNNIYEDFTSYTCNLPGTLNSYCSNFTMPILKKLCDGFCLNGECINCFSDLECGNDGYIGEEYCVGNEVYQNYQSFTCELPGTSDSDCTSDVVPHLKETCSDTCYNGSCLDFVCYNNSDCDDANEYTIDVCNNPGTPSSYCSHTQINCINDNDCGTTGHFGQEYCFEGNIFKDYRNATCINAGTPQSYCDTLILKLLKVNCGQSSCGIWEYYCSVDENVYRKRTCYDVGCSEFNGQGCFNNTRIENELFEECAFGCVNGTCNSECEIDSDCAHLNLKYCDENIAKTDIGFCDEGICKTNTTSENCGITSCGGWEYYCKFGGDDLWRMRTCQIRGCSFGECFSYPNPEDELYEICSPQCGEETIWG